MSCRRRVLCALLAAAMTSCSTNDPGTQNLAHTAAADLAAVRHAFAEGPSRYDSFAATVTVTSSRTAGEGTSQQLPSPTHQVYVFDDGRLWVQRDEDEWASYDPATSTTRVAQRSADGSIRCRQLDDMTENRQLLAAAFANQLPMNGEELLDHVKLEDSRIGVESFEGRPAWRLEGSYDDDGGGETPPFHTEFTFVIDQQTGLVVVWDGSSTDENGSGRKTVALTHLRTDVAMPAQFPGSCAADPDGGVPGTGEPPGS